MTVILPNNGDTNWGTPLNSAVNGLDDRVTTLETGKLSRVLVEVSENTTRNFTLSDAGKLMYTVHAGLSGDTLYATFPIPTNETVTFPIGTVIKFFARSTTLIVLSLEDDATTSLFPEGLDANLPILISPNCLATLIKVDTEVWALSGQGLSLA